MQPGFFPPRDPSAVHSPSPLGRRKSTTYTPTSDHLEKILQSIRQQIEKWGTNAKWKIDLELTDPGDDEGSPLSSSTVPAVAPNAPNIAGAAASPLSATTTAEQKQQQGLAISAATLYPWDYEAPMHDPWKVAYSEEQEYILRDTLERNHYLEGIVRAQANQLQYQHLPPDLNRSMEVMKHIYLMTENEHRLRYTTEARMLHNDIQSLTKRLQRMAQILQSIEDMPLPTKDTEMDKEALLADRKVLLRKQQLMQLRLKTRDAEIAYLTDRVKRQAAASSSHPMLRASHLPHGHASNSSPLMSKAAAAAASGTSLMPPGRGASLSPSTSPRFGDKRPYLFQQQYSPKLRSEIGPGDRATGAAAASSAAPLSPRSGLDSLGMLADQMLSDPDFDQHHSDSDAPHRHKRTHMYIRDDVPGGSHSFRPFEKRSKRSIDSATTLLSMFPTQASGHDEVMQEQPAKPEKTRSKFAYVRWTPDEDALLRSAVEELGTGNWDRIASRVPNRNSQQCRQRWSKYLDKAGGASGSPSARHSPTIASLLNTNNKGPDSHPPPSASSSSNMPMSSSAMSKPRTLSPIRQSPPPPPSPPAAPNQQAQAPYKLPSPVDTPREHVNRVN
ncbi:hypothetical protein BC940DRAFT_295449 [Gongronella butleri]|nr:hypothetical protein BC940DRAFT_295449 [Gongronella butleri]